MTVRLAALSDIPALIRLRFDFFDDDPVMALTDAQKSVLEPQLRSYYEKHLNKDFFAALVETSGCIAAVSFLVIHEKPANYRFPTGKTAEILNVFAYTEYRFNGYATAALKLLIEKAQQETASFIELAATSAGKPVYEKLGFEARASSHSTPMILNLL